MKRPISVLMLLCMVSCAHAPRAGHSCDLAEAVDLIRPLAGANWSEWSPARAKSELPGLQPVSRRTGPPLFLSVSWDGNAGMCTCCATLDFEGGAHLTSVVVFHREPTRERALAAADQFARAADNMLLVNKISVASGSEPFEIAFATDVAHQYQRLTSFRLFRIVDEWYWQYEESRGSALDTISRSSATDHLQ